MDKFNSWSPYLTPFYTLQYPTSPPKDPDSFHESPYYNVGKPDIYLVITCIAVMAVLRDAFRLLVFEPFARWKLTRDLMLTRRRKAVKTNGAANSYVGNGNGHVSNGNGHLHSNGDANGVAGPPPTAKEMRQLNRKVLRFAEQGWSVIYYSIQWAFGLYVHYNLPTRLLDPIDLWLAYPHIPIAAPVKIYYLTQTAFYFHQILVLNAEARRKDHVQMMSHHIITVVLILGSYFTNFTRVGCVIMMLMDCCDIFLPLAKMIRYLDISQFACDFVFAIFMFSWLITRHFLFLFVIYSTIFEGPNYVEFKWDYEGSYYVTQTNFTIFCVLLLALQVIQCIWFGMICRVAWRVVSGSGASDDRSDDEDDTSASDKKDN
ncbi:hypothetical protein GALMADRAFT_236178 [Galerina marginata CBS 339.88]|uniref:TLC domain-containing protein n=1 Tax=Galerina marginata (strain CBS 339.88) TaxID=685588 RepID=A0A067TXM6_GALM3|nr:hypothetical protein GALMADRAFT_236178 [Galerina marginata CBS 339.88]